MATETIYGTNEESHVMSEKVQSLAATVYKEFEKVIKKYDEDVVKDLMPLVVGILETLDATFTEKQELDVEIELLREDNEQLLTQYEREKQLRKSSEQKYLEIEDTIEGVKKELEDKVETLESILRMSEIKAKNSADHVSRLEEKEQETKNEYNKLHERYTELFRTHMDYMERTKILMGTDKLSDLTGMSPRITKGGFHLPGLRPVSMAYGGLIEFQNRHETGPLNYETGTPQNILTLKSELDAQTPKKCDSMDKEQLTDSAEVTEQATITMASTPELEESQEGYDASQGLLNKRKSACNDNSIFEEFSVQDADIAEVDFGADITDSDEHEENEEEKDDEENDKDSVGDNFFGMGKELENLILENTELLATKNALNIVKDDLIAKVDELSSEQEILREEITSLQAVKGRLQLRIAQLEEELKRIKEENDKKQREQNEKGEEEDDLPMVQRKRFTRVEMARVLMERNQYKERLMELQEAVRWTEMIRASKEHPAELQAKKKSTVWNFFSEFMPLSYSAPATSAPLQIPERHQSVLQAALNYSSHQHPHLASSSGHHEPDSVVSSSASLLPSPSETSLSSLPNITLLPPPDKPPAPNTGPAPVPLVLPAALPNLPPTPSGAPPPQFIPTLPLNSTVPRLFTPLPVSVKSHHPNSTLPGIRALPEHPVKHL